MALPTQTGVQFIEPGQLVYAESNGNYTWFHLLGGQKILVSRQLGEYEKILPAQTFCRIHDKYIIHLHHLLSYTKGAGGEVSMAGQVVLPVAVRRKDQLMQLFDAWLKRS
jgi:two-component system LytT family response regulator